MATHKVRSNCTGACGEHNKSKSILARRPKARHKVDKNMNVYDLTSQTHNLMKKGPTMDNTEVMRDGKKIIIPEGMEFDDVIAAIRDQEEYEQTIVNIEQEIKGFFIPDAGYAFYKALKEECGMVHQHTQKSFFGDSLPEMKQIAMSKGETVQIPWGQFHIPVLGNGTGHVGVNKDSNSVFLTASLSVRRKYSDKADNIFRRTREILKTDSLYRGKALEVKFIDDDHENLNFPEIKFMEDLNFDLSNLVFNAGVHEEIFTNLIIPIIKYKKFVKKNIHIRRGILLYGDHGTGKTLTAGVVARLAAANGFTFIYIRRPEEIIHAQTITDFYSPAVVFCEDIDPIMDLNEFARRHTTPREFLNIFDDISAKRRSTITVLTTNMPLSKLHKGFLRPGRIDAAIEVQLPDKESVKKLLHVYGSDNIPDSIDLNPVAEILEGQRPAAIAEVIKRGIFAQMGLDDSDDESTVILSEHTLVTAANQIVAQVVRAAEGRSD